MSERQYNEKATQEWLDKLAAKTAIDIETALREKDIAQDAIRGLNKAEFRSFLKRSAQGFGAEMMRQVRDNTPGLNDPDLLTTEAGRALVERESKTGLFHAAAVLRWVRDHMPQVNDKAQERLMAVIIGNSVENFQESFHYIAKTDEQWHPCAIRFDIESIRRQADVTSVAGPSLDATTTPVTTR